MKKRTKTKKYSFLKLLGGLFSPFLTLLRMAVPVAILLAVFILSFQGARKHLFADDFFNLSEIKFETDGILTTGEVSKIAGIVLNRNLLELDLREMTGKLEVDRRIKQAMVERILPNQLLIRINERREFLKVKIPMQEKYLFMDEEGYILGPAREEVVLPVFQDLRAEGQGFFKGDRYQDVRLLRNIFLMREILQSEGSLFRQNKITNIDVYSAEKIAIIMDNSVEIRLAQNFKADLEKLKAMKPLLESEIDTFEYLDLRFENIVAKRKDPKKAVKAQPRRKG